MQSSIAIYTCARIQSHLTKCLQEDKRLNVTNGSSNLNQTHIWRSFLPIHALVRNPLNPILNGTSHVRDHLHSLAQVVTPALGTDHALVHLASGDVMVFRQLDIQEPLVVSKIQVCFASIFEHEYLAVFKGRHRTSIDVLQAKERTHRKIQTKGNASKCLRQTWFL